MHVDPDQDPPFASLVRSPQEKEEVKEPEWNMMPSVGTWCRPCHLCTGSALESFLRHCWFQVKSKSCILCPGSDS